MNTLVAATALGWVGTPYRHRASVKNVGTDCLGLILGVWREVGGAVPESLPIYAPGWREACPQEMLWRALEQHLAPANREIAVGDIALLRMRDEAAARHLGIITGTARAPRLVHAYSGRGVVESILGKHLRRRIVARFRFPSE